MHLKNWGDDPTCPLLHGVGVLYKSKGVLLIGPSGCGKSSFALELMHNGAKLIADDRIYAQRQGGQIIMRRPAQIKNKIEAYGLGIMHCDSIETAPLDVVIDMAEPAHERLPAGRQIEILDMPVPYICHTQNRGFIHALSLFLSHGYAED